MKCFASDNYASVHPLVLNALAQANQGHAKAYGDDPWTARALAKVQEQFGPGTEVFFVFNGTGANVLSLKAATHSHHAIVCSKVAHIEVDECGAPEAFTGCKLITLESADGKIQVDQLNAQLADIGNQHHVQPKVISITQSTEYGTVYGADEIKALADFAHANEMLLHMDGARLANAAASLELSLRALTRDCGVDILSFGGTKNGMMFGEAVVIFNPALAKNFKYVRKQGMQLASKMRFIAAQFEALLTDELWLKNAKHSNAMAALLASELAQVPKIKLIQKVQANGVFVRMPNTMIEKLQQKFFFYIWPSPNNNAESAEVRLMASFDTTRDEILAFVAAAKSVV